MRQLLLLAFILVFAGTALAVDTASIQKTSPKNPANLFQDQAYDREGGEDMATAVPITALPFDDTGATCDNIDDWDEECPYTGSTSPDVWYSYTPAVDELINVDLFGSAYDTKTYILDGSYTAIACNDDYYSDYTSFLEAVPLTGGVTYYIVVDGYAGACGTYTLNIAVFTPPEPCILECAGVPEGEPDNGPSYDDMYNGGCNTSDTDPWAYVQALTGDENGNLTFCGVGGWNAVGKDTDWYSVTFGASGQITWTVESEVPGWFFEIAGQVCDGELINIMALEDCEEGTVTLTGTPGSQAWIWAGAQEYSPPSGFEGYNFDYTMTFTGLQEGPVATESSTWGTIKSMYR